LSRLSEPRVPALVIFVVASAAIGGAWIIEGLGYKPCELCLLGRIPYYAGLALAAVTALAAFAGRAGLARAGLAGLALVFLVGAGIAFYHTGVELKFWPGPAECTGTLTRDLAPEDFLKALRRVKPVRCDEPALFIFGLSLAAWSVLISAALGAYASWSALGLPRRRPL
jgi:disulfide bond formation protein DsbB